MRDAANGCAGCGGQLRADGVTVVRAWLAGGPELHLVCCGPACAQQLRRLTGAIGVLTVALVVVGAPSRS